MTGYTTRDGRSWTAHWEVGSALTRGAGRQKQKGGFRSRRDADRFLATAVAGRADAGRLKPSRRPLAEYLTEQWLPHAAAKVRPTTLIFYKQMVNHHIASREIGSLPICDITPLALNALYRDLARCRDPACVHDDVCSGLSAATCVSVHGVLNRALADAARWDLLPGNPAAMADGPVRRPAEMPVWTVFELERFLQFAVRDRLYALWQLAAATGMRRGELLGLTWPDVDLKQGSVRIQRQLLALEGAIALGPPKTRNGARTIAIDVVTRDALEDHRVLQEEERKLLGHDYNDLNLVFSNTEGRPVRPNTMSERFRQLRIEAGLRAGSPQVLRHTWATLALTADPEPGWVSRRPGLVVPSFHGLREGVRTVRAA